MYFLTLKCRVFIFNMANIINKEIGKCIINTYDSNTPNNQFQVVLLVLTVTFYWCFCVSEIQPIRWQWVNGEAITRPTLNLKLGVNHAKKWKCILLHFTTVNIYPCLRRAAKWTLRLDCLVKILRQYCILLTISESNTREFINKTYLFFRGLVPRPSKR